MLDVTPLEWRLYNQLIKAYQVFLSFNTHPHIIPGYLCILLGFAFVYYEVSKHCM